MVMIMTTMLLLSVVTEVRSFVLPNALLIGGQTRSPTQTASPWSQVFQRPSELHSTTAPLNGEEIKARLDEQLERMKEKDKTSKAISKEVSFIDTSEFAVLMS